MAGFDWLKGMYTINCVNRRECLLKVSLDIYAESERSLHVTLCWNIINITKCLLSLEFVVWNCRPALQYFERLTVMVNNSYSLKLSVFIVLFSLNLSDLYFYTITMKYFILKLWISMIQYPTANLLILFDLVSDVIC